MFVVALAALLVGVPTHAGAGQCRAPADVLKLEAPLPVLCRTLASGGAVRIVALGSSSTEGAGATSKDRAYPARLEAALRERFPGLDISVTNRGKGGQLVTDMISRLETDVMSASPTLVIWQTGVNDAIRNVDLARFERDVESGLQRMRAAGIDVILLDQQYYPKAATVVAYKDFMRVIRDVGARNKVPVFRRYELMAHLVKSAQYKVEDLLAHDLFHQNDTSYQCLGTTIAEALKASFAASAAAAAGPVKAKAPASAHIAGSVPEAAAPTLEPASATR